MAIIRTASPKYYAPVSHKILSETGALQELKFDMQFKRLKQSEREAQAQAQREINQQIERAKADGEDENQLYKKNWSDILAANACGWRGVTEADKTDVPFSLENLFELCEEYPGLLGSIFSAWAQSLNPTEAAHLATKN